MKKHVYTDTHRNEDGFSMISMLITITIIFISLPFLTYLLSSLSYSSHQELISVNQFFLFLRDELFESSHINIDHPQSISYELDNGDLATISKYNDLIRRRVEKKGHEIYLREISELLFKETPLGIEITITTRRGEVYEKKIILYN